MLRAYALLLSIAAGGPASATVLTIADDGEISVNAPPLAKATGKSRPRTPLPPAELASGLAAAADRQQLANELIAAVAWVESRFRPGARSPAGAIGIMQLMPATARDLGVDPHEPSANLHGGAAYLRQMLDRYDGDLVRAIAAYNAGPGAVDRHGGVPPFAETRHYVAAVLSELAAPSLNHPGVTP